MRMVRSAAILALLIATLVPGQALALGEADALSALNIQGTALGTSLAGGAANLNISATGVYFRLVNANIVNVADIGHGQDRKTIGETTWQAVRSFDGGTGAPEDLFYIGTAAPV